MFHSERCSLERNTMDELNKISKNFYKVVLAFKDALVLPTDSSLFSTFKYSCVLTVICLLAKLLGFYTFLSWYGCLTCTLLLLLLLLIERSENHALLEMYRAAQVRARKIARRQQEAGTGSSVLGDNDMYDSGTEDGSRRT